MRKAGPESKSGKMGVFHVRGARKTVDVIARKVNMLT